ncbi:helix-turn-helix domain-containing protein [Streptomyces coelicoflavus]|uniref:helix-turn-helix domain-containing protein n=1 Tax=Streptomyces coelicoflavus TaxID=285562 RepID=UPI0036A5CE95
MARHDDWKTTTGPAWTSKTPYRVAWERHLHRSSKVSPSTGWVALVFIGYAEVDGTNRTAPSMDTIAEDIGKGVKTVQRAFADLESQSLLIEVERGTPGKASAYLVRIPGTAHATLVGKVSKPVNLDRAIERHNALLATEQGAPEPVEETPEVEHVGTVAEPAAPSVWDQVETETVRQVTPEDAPSFDDDETPRPEDAPSFDDADDDGAPEVDWDSLQEETNQSRAAALVDAYGDGRRTRYRAA